MVYIPYTICVHRMCATVWLPKNCLAALELPSQELLDCCTAAAELTRTSTGV